MVRLHCIETLLPDLPEKPVHLKSIVYLTLQCLASDVLDPFQYRVHYDNSHCSQFDLFFAWVLQFCLWVNQLGKWITIANYTNMPETLGNPVVCKHRQLLFLCELGSVFASGSIIIKGSYKVSHQDLCSLVKEHLSTLINCKISEAWEHINHLFHKSGRFIPRLLCEYCKASICFLVKSLSYHGLTKLSQKSCTLIKQGKLP